MHLYPYCREIETVDQHHFFGAPAIDGLVLSPEPESVIHQWSARAKTASLSEDEAVHLLVGWLNEGVEHLAGFRSALAAEATVVQRLAVEAEKIATNPADLAEDRATVAAALDRAEAAMSMDFDRRAKVYQRAEQIFRWADRVIVADDGRKRLSDACVQFDKATAFSTFKVRIEGATAKIAAALDRMDDPALAQTIASRTADGRFARAIPDIASTLDNATKALAEAATAVAAATGALRNAAGQGGTV